MERKHDDWEAVERPDEEAPEGEGEPSLGGPTPRASDLDVSDVELTTAGDAPLEGGAETVHDDTPLHSPDMGHVGLEGKSGDIGSEPKGAAQEEHLPVDAASEDEEVGGETGSTLGETGQQYEADAGEGTGEPSESQSTEAGEEGPAEDEGTGVQS